jgi:hypothetical protein
MRYIVYYKDGTTFTTEWSKNPYGALMIYDDKGRTVRWVSNEFDNFN